MSFWKQYPKLTFDEKDHIYRYNDRAVPSVTGIFDSIGIRKNDSKPFRPIGCPDFAKNKHDSDFGNALHKMACAVVSGKEVLFPDDMQPYYYRLKSFLINQNLAPVFDLKGHIVTEYPLFSVKHKFAGTPDLLCRDKKGKLWLIDWKSGSIYHQSYSWQTAGYDILIREVFGDDIMDPREKIIRCTVLFPINKDEVELVVRDNQPEDIIYFRSILNTYKLVA